MGRKALREFNIPFVGLKEGVHVFNFEVGETFFKEFEGSYVHGGNVQVELQLDKKVNFFILEFGIEGTVTTECDRCLKQMELPILDEHRMYVKFDDELSESDEEDDEIMYLSSKATHLDVSKLMYEFILLSVPVKRVCPPKEDGSPGCDEEVLKYIDSSEEISSEATPEDTPDEKDEDNIDPRWSELKKLKE